MQFQFLIGKKLFAEGAKSQFFEEPTPVSGTRSGGAED
jgi:hypothetical protein